MQIRDSFASNVPQKSKCFILNDISIRIRVENISLINLSKFNWFKIENKIMPLLPDLFAFGGYEILTSNFLFVLDVRQKPI